MAIQRKGYSARLLKSYLEDARDSVECCIKEAQDVHESMTESPDLEKRTYALAAVGRCINAKTCLDSVAEMIQQLGD